MYAGAQRGGAREEQFPGSQITAGGAVKSQQCHKYFPQYSTFASERPQVRTWGRQTCFLPRAPANLITPLNARSLPLSAVALYNWISYQDVFVVQFGRNSGTTICSKSGFCNVFCNFKENLVGRMLCRPGTMKSRTIPDVKQTFWEYVEGQAKFCGTMYSRGDSWSNASFGFITRFIPRPLTECNRSRLASLKFPFALILASTALALWRPLRNNECEVLVRTPPLRA